MTIGFKNECFNLLKDVEERLSQTIRSLTREMVKCITNRDWLYVNYSNRD